MQAQRHIDHEQDAQLLAWRSGRLRAAGFAAALAAAVAADGGFDLHALLELVDRGCAPELAVRILAPIDGSPW
jgi:hypothetical protein